MTTIIAQPEMTTTAAPRILAHYQGIKIRVIDCFHTDREFLAVIEAMNGKPFVGGDKWPVTSSRTIVQVGELEQFVLSFTAHAHQWMVLKSNEAYDLYRFDLYAGIPLPKYICSASRETKLEISLRKLAERAAALHPLTDFNFLYDWMK